MTTIIRNGTLFDGTGTQSRDVDLLIGDNGNVAEIGVALEAPVDAEVIDADGCWVTPGFVDIHTHYDAEVEAAPALSESVRHGVTTVLIGSCGLSLVVGEPEDLADTFCRVEGIPREQVLPLLEDVVDWKDPAGYIDHLSSLPLGPNLVTMLGHSTARSHVMGLGRSLDRDIRPDAREMAEMERLVAASMDAGQVGLSANSLPWDKMGGSRFRSRATPSVYARQREYRRLANVVRRRDGVFEVIPNLQTRGDIAFFADLSRPRKGQSLRVSLLALMDAPPTMGAYRVVAAAGDMLNKRMGANLRMQALPTPFDMYTDGIENPVFEEFGAGTEALHLENLESRAQLMSAPVYRSMFRKQWKNKIAARAFHRDLSEARIISCPDSSLDGKTFEQVAIERGADPLDTFLDLQIQYGNDLRWYSVVANGNLTNLEWIMSQPLAMIGFSDAGAHLRNMAFYNFPLRMLKRVRDAQLRGQAFMTTEEAVRKLTSDPADFHRVDAGRVEVGKRADIVVIDPTRLDDSVEAVEEASMAEFGGLQRMVRRNDDTVRAVLVNGNTAWSGGELAKDLGTARRFGSVLPLLAN